MTSSDILILVICIFGFVGIGFAIYKVTITIEKDAPIEIYVPPIPDAPIVNPQLRNRRRNQNDDENEIDDGENEEGPNMTKRDLLKYEKRQAKAEAKAQEDARREARREKDMKREEQYRERELEREKEFMLIEEENARIKAEKELQEKLQYNHWKDAPTLSSDISSKDIETMIIQKIESQQKISLEKLSSELNISLVECVLFIESLEKKELLFGVTDEKGIYHRCSIARMTQYIHEHGKVHISEIIRESKLLADISR